MFPTIIFISMFYLLHILTKLAFVNNLTESAIGDDPT